MILFLRKLTDESKVIGQKVFMKRRASGLSRLLWEQKKSSDSPSCLNRK